MKHERRCIGVAMVLALTVFSGCAPASEGQAAAPAPPPVTPNVVRTVETTVEVASVAGRAEPAGEISPKDYVDWHRIVGDPHAEGWRAAIDHVAEIGDRFTVDYLSGLDRSKWDESAKKVLDATVVRVRARVPGSNAPASGVELERILEHAAWADVRCDPLEGKIVPWTKKYLASIIAAPGVRDDLERIKSNYKPRTDEVTLFSSLSRRVPEYAAGALKPPRK